LTVPVFYRMDKDFQLVEGDDDEEEGDTLYGTYEPGRAVSWVHPWELTLHYKHQI
jgi:hypothetical protein